MGVPIATITSEGTTLDSTVELLALEIHSELNRIPEASLTLLDGSVAKRAFTLSNTAFFEPGKQVAVALRYEGDEADVTVFEGFVVRHGVEAQAAGSVLRVDLKDAAFKLTRQRKSAVFRDQTDGEAIRQLIEDVGLEAGDIGTTQPQHAELIQYYASDWDFIVSRADIQGLVVQVALGKVSLLPMAPSGGAQVTFEYGLDDVYELELELDAGSQYAEISSVAWDVGEQKVTDPTNAADPGVTAGNLDAAAIAGTLGGDAYTLLHPATLQADELQAWADARLTRSRLAMLRGRLVVNGRTDVAPGDAIELGGVSDRFDGEVLVSGVIHRLDHDGWRTELLLGLAPDWFAREPDIADVTAAGLLPPVQNLQVATVAAFEEDPDGEQRIKLKLPCLAEEHGFVWARVARPDAGEERGEVFWPEPEDEVVVGFINGDPRQAVMLGSLYSSAKPPPEAAGAPSEDNFKRAIVSKAGTTVVFDDEKPSVTIMTPAENTITIDDDDASITIADQHGNTIVMSDSGITLTSAADISIEADGDVTIAGNAVDVK